MSQNTTQINVDGKQYVFHCNSYTTVTNHCLEDVSLSLEARGLLVTMFSLKDDWHYSIQGLTKILPHGSNKISRVIKELEDHGYVERSRTRNKAGQFVYSFHFFEESQIYHDERSGKNHKTVKNISIPQSEVVDETRMDTESYPAFQNEDVEIGDVESPVVENDAQSNTQNQKTNINLLKSINHSERNENKATALSSQEPDDAIDVMDRKMAIRDEFKEKLCYEQLLMSHPEQRKLVELIFEVIAETLAHSEVNYKKISGQSYSYMELKATLEDLEYEHLEYVLSCIAQSEPCIKSPANYVLQCLLKAGTMDVYNSYRTKKVYRPANRFTQFQQNEYDYEALEEALLDN